MKQTGQGREAGLLRRVRVTSQAVLWLAALVAVTGLAASRDVSVVDQQYLLRHWLADEGVPENSALAVAHTPDGFLWVGSSGGLLRFNGNTFKSAVELGAPLQAGSAIISLHVDRSGRLWASTLEGALIHERGSWRTLAPTNVMIRTLVEDKQGKTWVGDFTGHAFRVTNDQLGPLADAEKIPAPLTGSGVFFVADRRDGSLWLANRGFIGRWDGQAWARFGPETVERESVVAGAAQEGGLWVYQGGKLRRFCHGQLTQVLPAPLVDQPRELVEDRRGHVWIVSNSSGLTRIDRDSSVLVINAANGLIHNSSRCLLEDAEGNLWLGTSAGGLTRLRERFFHTLSTEVGMPDRLVRTVTEAAPGRLVAGTHGGGLAFLEDQRVVQAGPLGEPSRGAHVWSVLRDRDGRLWSGTYGEGLFVMESNRWTQVPLPAGMGEAVYSLMQDASGRIWVGTSEGLACLEGGACREWQGSPDLRGCSIRCMAEETATHTLWLGTYRKGLFRVAGTHVTRLGKAEGLPGERISSLHLDEDGCLWAGVFGQGLVCWREGKVTRFGEAQGLTAKTIGSILDDGLGFFWMGSDRGIVRVAKSELHQLARKEIPRAAFNVFDEGDGLRTLDCSEGYQPTAARDSTGRLWFATLNGLATVDPRGIQLNTQSPPVVFERIAYRNAAGNLQEIAEPDPNHVVLPAGSYDVEVRAAALSYAAPEKCQYAFRFRGSQGEWINLRRRRVFYFQSLQPGDYRLEVRASNNDGVWNETGAVMALRVEAYFWQRLWFRAALLVLGLGGVGGGVWWFTQSRLRARIAWLEHQRALEEERSRLATVLEATTDLVAFADPEGKLLFLNAAGRGLLGLSLAQDLRTLSLADLHPTESAEGKFRTALATACAAGTWQGELGLLRQDGRTVPVSQVIVAHKDRAGRVNFLSTIARDITNRKMRDELLEKLAGSPPAEGLVEFCRQVSRYLATTLDVEYAFIAEVDHGLARVLGGYALGQPLTDFTYDLRHTPCELVSQQSFCLYPRDVQGAFPLDHLLVEMQIEAYVGVPLLDRAGATLGIMVALSRHPFADATLAANLVKVFAVRAGAELERQRAEAELLRREQHFRSLIENSTDLIIVMDPAGVISYISPSVERIMGYAPAEVLGSQRLDWVHPEDHHRVAFAIKEAAPALGTPVALSYRVRHKNGSWRLFESSRRRIESKPGEEIIIVNARDITESARLAEQLRQSQKMEAIGQLSGGVAHDFNNILTIIQGHVSLLLMQDHLAADARESIAEIGQSAERAANLTRQLLAFSRRQIMQAVLLDLNEVVTNLTRMLNRLVGEHIIMQLRYSPRPAVVKADSSMLEQVLLNLVVNARDAMPTGGSVVIETAVTQLKEIAVTQMPQARTGEFVTLSVSDTGCGIAPDILPRIFEPFFTTKDVGKGTGLGLATVYGIVEQHQGWIHVHSELGKGTTFRVYLPLQKWPISHVAEPASLGEAPGGCETILVVEDDPAVRALVRKVLSRLGYAVLEAPSGAKAFEVWAERHAQIDLLLTDLVMPDGVNGRDLARRLLAEQPGLRVLYTSGYSAALAGQNLVLQDGVNFISKPYDTIKLAQIVRAALDA